MTDIKHVFFGIMGDLYGDAETENVDHRASLRRYAELSAEAIKREFGEGTEVDWDIQENVGGVTPWGLKTRVNGDTEHEDVERVDDIIGQVWQAWDWLVLIGSKLCPKLAN